ncbi:MAG: DNRLRE domain-containing protein [Calditrichota bacterium]
MLSAVILLSACAQPEGPVGSEVGDDLGGVARVDSFQVDASACFIAPHLGTGGSSHLYVGSGYGLNVQSLIRFSPPRIPAGWTLDSTRQQRLRLTAQGGIGEGSFPVIEARRMHRFWSEANPPHWGDVSEGENLRLEVAVNDTGKGYISLFLEAEWFKQWMTRVDSIRADATASDSLEIDTSLTIWLFSDEAQDRLARILSRNSIADSLRPRLTIYAFHSDTVGMPTLDSLSSTAAADAFLVHNDSTDTEGRLVVGSGAVYQFNLRFDLSRLQRRREDYHIVVNRALLILQKIPEAYPQFPQTLSLWPFKLTDDRWLTDPDSSSEAGFTVITTSVNQDSMNAKITLTNLAAEWIADSTKNHGLAVHSGGEGLDLNRIAFYGASSSPQQRPRLRIYWTEIPR